ncbi:hypothetical protein BURK1_01814 [Burkholderiales bacterium]|nr:hypothetical protein BURK1_01814 [Burkholderiales bacterium]
MSLTPPVPRELLHTRSVVCEGYRRDDGLFDLEARLVDTKPRPFTLMTGVRRPGEPVHDMWIRVTIDRGFTIHAVEASMPAVPYPGGCERIEPAYATLIGANLIRGFRRFVKERLGGVHGCSHMTEIVGHLPTAAVQMFASLVREDEGHAKPFQLDQCHALETRSETVRRYYPGWYRGAA